MHADAPTAGATDWRQILALYDQLLAVAPTPVVALNRAVAVAEVDGPEAALRIVEPSPRTRACSTTTRCTTPSAPICSSASAGAGRRAALDAALARTANTAERRVLARRRRRCRTDGAR